MSKKSISLVIALILALSIITFPASADDPISVYLDGVQLTFDVPPQLMNDRTMVPLRAVFEAMGAHVDWDGDTETVTGTKGDTVVVLTIGDTSPTINGQVVTIDQPGVIVNDRTLAPLRFVGEAFGGTVDWDGDTQTVTIISGGEPISPPVIALQPTPTPTPEPTAAPPTTTEPPTTGYAKLVGTWYNTSSDNRRYWSFGADGRFAYLIVFNNRGTTSERYSQGKYRVSGDVIECYEIQNESYFVNDNRQESFFEDYDPIFLDKVLLATTIQDPGKIDDFSIKFEFAYSIFLRIDSDRLGDQYDMEFSYVSDNFKWPNDLIMQGLPEYRGGGSITSIEFSNLSPGGNVKMIINGATLDEMADYARLLINAGWKQDSYFSIDNLVEKGKGDINLAKDGLRCTVFYGKDLYSGEVYSMITIPRAR